MTSSSYPAVVLQQPSEPPFCHGSTFEDPENWLEQVERVRLFNRWDDAATQRQVLFYPEDSARIWFENHRSCLETSNNFRMQFLTTFTTVVCLETSNDFRMQFLTTFTTIVRKELVELLLQTRTQHPNDSVVVFAEEMKMLFGRADPEMAEEKKVRFLMWEVQQELFARLIRNLPKTDAAVVTEASMIEETLDLRWRQQDRPINALLTTPGNTPGLTTEDLLQTICAVLREKQRKLF